MNLFKLKKISITIKILLFTLAIGIVVWKILDDIQAQDIQKFFFSELSDELEIQARENRLLFDQHVRSHLQAAKIVTSQQRFRAYLTDPAWLDNKDQTIKHHYRLPLWLPTSSVMQTFFNARYAFLIDQKGQVKEIYHYFPDTNPPAALLQTKSKLQSLSNNQAYMTTLDDFPYVITSQRIEDEATEEVLAILMLASPIDDLFLTDAMGNFRPDTIVALLQGEPLKVISSSKPNLFAANTLINTIKENYLITGTSFFDYGESDLKIQFASFVPTKKAYHIADSVLKKVKEQRAMFAIILVLSFAFLTFWIAQGIRRVTRQITQFSKDSLGVETYQTDKGDEIERILHSFEQLRDSITQTISRANAIASGDYSNELQHRSEQDQLGLALTNMNNTLQNQAKELRQQQETLYLTNDALKNLNEQLEQRVSDRTTQLESTNKDLQKALETVQRTQKQLVESEKMSALGGLVAGIAHEINTPIGVGVTAASALDERVKTFSDLFESSQLKKADLKKFITSVAETSNIILPNLNRAAELIRSFKRIAIDQTSLELREFNVQGYLEEILLSLRPKLKKTKHQVEIQCPPNFELYGHAGNFSQVVTNLLMNSLMHAYEEEEEGHIVLSVTQEKEGFLHFCYTDDGKGISPENLSKVFDPFFTTARGRGGSGLGLSVVYNIVTQNMGGNIHCESTVGQGANFHFDIPIKKVISPST